MAETEFKEIVEQSLSKTPYNYDINSTQDIVKIHNDFMQTMLYNNLETMSKMNDNIYTKVCPINFGVNVYETTEFMNKVAILIIQNYDKISASTAKEARIIIQERVVNRLALYFNV